jgi:peptidyl-prolyl cis-trans isomerase D
VLDQLVEGLAFDQFATEMGFSVSKRLIDGRIADLPAFAGVSGKFDQKVFENFLRQNGLTETQLRRDLRQQLLIEQLAAPIAMMPRIAPGMAQPYAALLMEQRRGQATFIPASPFAPTADPGDAVLKKYLSQNAAKFTVPERRVIQYALFDRSAVPVPAVTDAEIAKVYKDNASQYAASETRRFAQVIVPDQAAANSLASQGSRRHLARRRGAGCGALGLDHRRSDPVGLCRDEQRRRRQGRICRQKRRCRSARCRPALAGPSRASRMSHRARHAARRRQPRNSHRAWQEQGERGDRRLL